MSFDFGPATSQLKNINSPFHSTSSLILLPIASSCGGDKRLQVEVPEAVVQKRSSEDACCGGTTGSSDGEGAKLHSGDDDFRTCHRQSLLLQNRFYLPSYFLMKDRTRHSSSFYFSTIIFCCGSVFLPSSWSEVCSPEKIKKW